jgi:hypothetical protein
MEDNTRPLELVLDPLLEFRKSVMPVADRQSQQYSVRGYAGGGYNIGSPEGRAANCHFAVNEAIEQGLHSLNNTFNWSRVGVLYVLPEAGRMWNAFYNRRTLQFYFNDDTINGRRTFASSAAKIVYHEAGHAVLDGIRPDLFNLANFETWAVHEAFGDLMAFLCTMRNSELHGARDRHLWTGIGLEFGGGIFRVKDDVYRPLRDLGIQFNWALSSTLPPHAPDDQLAAEPHSFSRIFSSAVYALFLRILDRNLSQGKPEPVAKAVETVGRYLIIGLSLSAVNEFYMNSVARAMMYVDWREGYPYLDLMNEVFGQQNILRPETKVTALSTQPKLTTHAFSTMCLADEEISAQSFNPLHSLTVQIGHDENSLRHNLREDVRLCLDYLHRNDLVDRPNSPFATWKGNLLRRHFACQFHR